MTREMPGSGNEIAIIGLAGRFPGAADVGELWRLLQAGREGIRNLSVDEAVERGVERDVAAEPSFVRAEALPEGIERFDASFFDMGRREAEITDPQHRSLLECAWEAFEDAGYDPQRLPGAAGVFAGATLNTYLPLHLLPRRELVDSLQPVQLNIGNAGDFLTTRISYKLGLKGPSYTVQCACSTSLVAVHVACQKLLDEECDLALAGGVSLNLSLRGGYRYAEGGMASPDGRCRPFDHEAQGTIFGGGAGLVVLRRLEDAVRDRDAIRAVIRGSAVNNDGSLKAGYTAPSVDGQAEVIAEALAVAGISPDTVEYVEAHGTATPLGDPIEIQALTKAFRAHTRRTGFCRIGSIKGNLGHLDAAAGVTGLIKTVLALEHEEIPPSLHFEQPNPQIDFDATPFSVVADGVPWRRGKTPRRAGVSAFGVGGTNAHVVVEEAPVRRSGGLPRAHQLLVLSARSPEALAAGAERLRTRLETTEDVDLADVAYTLQTGRHAFEHRRIVVSEQTRDAAAALTDPERFRQGSPVSESPRPVFLFPGQGTQYPGMARELYDAEPSFRRELDEAAEILRDELEMDFRTLLHPEDVEKATRTLTRTAVTQPVLFAVEHALARLLRSWGIEPAALLGHSLGEYVAATLAGVFAWEDALRLVARRGRRMESLPPGAMVSVPLAEAELAAWLDRVEGKLSVAVINGPGRTVASGSVEAVEELEGLLAEEGISARRLVTSHGFHSPQMEPILEAFREDVEAVPRHAPEIPFLSNLTGTWITPEEAMDSGYWVRHLRETVRFGDDLEELLSDERRVLLEVGPGAALGQLTRRHPEGTRRTVIDSLPGPRDEESATAVLTRALGRLWLAGVEPDWTAYSEGQRRLRVPLPTYAFQRKRYWVERPRAAPQAELMSPEITGDISGASVAEAASPGDAPPARTVPTEEREERPDLETVYVPPGHDLERRIASLWQDVLGVEPIGVLDNFFELGGDSLVAVQTIDRLKRELDIQVDVASLYEGVTVRALAQILDTENEDNGSGDDRRSRMASRRRYQTQRRRRRREGRDQRESG